MTSSIDDSYESTSLSEEIAVLLDGADNDRPDAFEPILDRVEGKPVREVVTAVETVVESDHDRLGLLPDLLDQVETELYLSEGTDAQRALLATVQRMVAKHHPNRRKELLPVLVDGLGDPARREEVAGVLTEISQYAISTARETIDELENAPSSLYSDPAAVDAVTDIVSSIEDNFHRFQGEVELPAVARLQIGTERDAAKKELLERVDRSEANAEEIVASMDQLLETVSDDSREARRSRQAARQIIFEIAIENPEFVVPYADRLVDASGIDEETTDNAYARILDADANTAKSLFVSVAVDSASIEEPDKRVGAITSLLPGAPEDIVTAIVNEVPESDLDSPPIPDETAEQLHKDSLHLLALLCTDATAPIGQQLVALELEEGEIRLAEDLATVIRESDTGQTFDGLSRAFENTDDLPPEITDQLAAGITDYLQRSNGSVELAATLAAPELAIGQEVLQRVLTGLDSQDDQPDLSEKRFREFVKHVGEFNPDVVAAQYAPILEYVVDDTPRHGLLESVGEALDRAPSTAVNDEPAALDLAVDLLDYEDADVVAHACRVVAHLEPYPAPRELIDLEDEAGGRIQQLAEWAIEYIEDASGDLETGLLDTPDDLKPAIKHLTLEDVVKYRNSNAWESLRLGPLEMDILNSIAANYNRDRSTVVTHPAHVPSITLLYAVALLCEGAAVDETPKVGIVSPVYWHERWGTFGDIEKEYQNYGVGEQDGTTIRAVTFDDLYGTAKVSDGDLSTDRRGSQAGKLVLTKSLDNLSQVADELTAIVVQAIERFKIPLPELADRIEEDFGDTPVFPIYSTTTKQDTGGVPALAPPSRPEKAQIDIASTEMSLGKIGEILPDVDAVRAAARAKVGTDREDALDRLPPADQGTLQAAGYTWDKEITVRAVGNEKLRDSMDEALDIGFDLDTGGSQVLGTAFRFERLPVDAADFDAWVEDQGAVDPRSRVDTFGDQLDAIEDSTDRDHVSSTTTIAVREGIRALDSVNDEFRDANPLFERLQSRLEETVDETDRVGVLVASQTFADATRDVLDDAIDVSLGEDVVVLTPEGMSSVLALDILFVVGPQRPAHAAVYFPRITSKVEVLTVGDFWENYLEKHASRYRSKLVEGLSVDSECLGELSITVEDETTAVEEPENRPAPTAPGEPDSSEADCDLTGAGTSGAASGEGGGSGTWMPDSLTEAFERAAEVDGEPGEGDGGYGDSPTYEIRTESDETVQLGRGEAIYRIEDATGVGQSYSWTTPSQLDPGDEILILSPEFIGPRRDEWLTSQYDNRFEDPETVFQGLYDWWTAMSDILSELDKQTPSSSGRGDPVLQDFYDAVESEGVDKHKQTVRLWIQAIEQTRAPIELATDTDATIGPDSASDIEAIGRAFDDPRLEDSADDIQHAMVRVRKFNAIGGRRYREVIEEQLETGHPEFREAATPYGVVEMRELND